MTLVPSQRGKLVANAFPSINNITYNGRSTSTSRASNGQYLNRTVPIGAAPSAGEKRAVVLVISTYVDDGTSATCAMQVFSTDVGAEDQTYEGRADAFISAYPSVHYFALFEDVPSGTSWTNVDIDFSVSGDSLGMHCASYSIYYDDSAVALTMTGDIDASRDTGDLSVAVTCGGNDVGIAAGFQNNVGTALASDLGGTAGFGTWDTEHNHASDDISGVCKTGVLTSTGSLTATLANGSGTNTESVAMVLINIV